jgi:alpha-galactosidase
MPLSLLHEYRLDDLVVRYLAPDDAPDQPGLMLLPASRRDEVVSFREHVDSAAVLNLPAMWLPVRAWSVDRLVQLHRREDPAPAGFSQGRTLRESKSAQDLRCIAHQAHCEGGVTRIETVLAGEAGLRCVHELSHTAGERMVRIRTRVANEGAEPITLEMLSSFSLGGITPFAADDAPGRLWCHRFRSVWSAEGRPEVRSLEDLSLERSWAGYGVRSERFGVAGSMPVSGWFPAVAVEDRVAGVTWGARLVQPGSWQLEVFRRADQVAISGGLADRELGHWSKVLQAGDHFETPEAWVTVANGGGDAVWERLLDGFNGVQEHWPETEQALGVIFNEWCTSWGTPTEENLIALADRLQGSGVRYLVIDDGWAERPGGLPQQNGDWKVNAVSFPNGLRAAADAIRARGLIPGIWFEMEVCNPGSKAWDETAHQLYRDGRVLQVGPRRFWDFRDPWVIDYLEQKLIALVRDSGIGYIKIDYNDTIGVGCDGAESLGEGLREHLEGVLGFFERIRQKIPGVVIENCSSGGHRLVPSFIRATAMSSFSDAHETPDIPIIAANLHALLPPRQNQIWAVLRQSDSAKRLVYSLAATFLGRMCLSGEVHTLNAEQWALTKRAIDLYQRVADLIACGFSTRQGQWGNAYLHPTGWQAVVRLQRDRQRAMVVIHTFEGTLPSAISVNLPQGDWTIVDGFSDGSNDIALAKAQLVFQNLQRLSAVVVVLARDRVQEGLVL